VARRDRVDGIGVVRDTDAAGSFQLVTKAYRPGTADRRGRGHLGKPFREHLRPHHRGLPEPRAVGVVEGDENLAAVAVEDREALAGRTSRADARAERVEGRDAAPPEAKAEGQPFGGRDADPQAGERAGPEPDGEQVDRLPAPGRIGAALDLAEQPGRVQRPSTLGEPEVRLGDDVPVPPGAGGGVGGRGVEADDDQGARPLGPVRPGRHYFTRKTEVPTFVPLTYQVTEWRPGVVEVILFT
jgi:hypothetical protein